MIGRYVWKGMHFVAYRSGDEHVMFIGWFIYNRITKIEFNGALAIGLLERTDGKKEI